MSFVLVGGLLMLFELGSFGLSAPTLRFSLKPTGCFTSSTSNHLPSNKEPLNTRRLALFSRAGLLAVSPTAIKQPPGVTDWFLPCNIR